MVRILRNVILMPVLYLGLTGCSGILPAPPVDTTVLAFDDGGYKGYFNVAVMPNSLPHVCIRPSPGFNWPDAPDCADGIRFLPENLPVDQLNSEAGVVFNLGAGPDPGHGWLLKARCEPFCPSQSDLGNLKFAPAPREDAEPISFFTVEEQTLKLRTAEVAIIPDYPSMATVMQKQRAFAPGTDIRVRLPYPSVYQFDLIEEERIGGEVALVRKPYYLKINALKEMEWSSRTQRVGLAPCNGPNMQNCVPGEPKHARFMITD